MAVYAAQVHAMDYNVGKLVKYLEKTGKIDNTLIFFMSDNGACAEPHNELGGGKQKDINNPAVSGHPSYGRAWAQVSNTPFRKYKQRAYEGGISTPLIISWKAKLGDKANTWCRTPAFLPDFMPTILNVAGAEYPSEFNGNAIHPMAGKDFMPAVKGKKKQLHDYIRATGLSDGKTGKQYGTRTVRSGNCTISQKTVQNATTSQKTTRKFSTGSRQNGINGLKRPMYSFHFQEKHIRPGRQ